MSTVETVRTLPDSTLSSAAGTDYNGSTVTLVTFTSGVTRLLHKVVIVNDNDREPSEKFNATLSTTESYVSIDNNTAIVTILDDEGKLSLCIPGRIVV